MNFTGTDKKEMFVLQTDPNTLLHLTNQLEAALQEAKVNYFRRLQHQYK